MKNNGSMAESVDAADLKSASENCAGSIPATATTMLQKLYEWIDKLDALKYSMPNKIQASCRISEEELAGMKLHEIESYIKEKLSRDLACDIVSHLADLESKIEHTTNMRIYCASVNAFTDEELKQHDQDIIEEFCSRK